MGSTIAPTEEGKEKQSAKSPNSRTTIFEMMGLDVGCNSTALWPERREEFWFLVDRNRENQKESKNTFGKNTKVSNWEEVNGHFGVNP